MQPCLYCQNSARFAPRGIDGATPENGFTPEYVEHLESKHNVVVRRPDETMEEADARLEARLLVDAQASGADLIAAADAESKKKTPARKTKKTADPVAV